MPAWISSYQKDELYKVYLYLGKKSTPRKEHVLVKSRPGKVQDPCELCSTWVQ